MTFYFDRNFGKRFPQAERIARPPRVTVEFHHDRKNKFHFNEKTQDDEWIAKVAAEGWIIFSHDRKWHDELPVISAIKQYNAACFYLWGADASTWDKLEAFIFGFERIVERVEHRAKPYIFNVGRQGQLTEIPIP